MNNIETGTFSSAGRLASYARRAGGVVMTGSNRGLEGPGAPWMAERPGGAWRAAAGLLPLAAALALWVWVLLGALAPLSAALARIDGSAREPAAAPACPLPPGALASAASAVDPPSCR
jgi:hypothetical protein